MAGELIRWKPSSKVEDRVKQALQIVQGNIPPVHRSTEQPPAERLMTPVPISNPPANRPPAAPAKQGAKDVIDVVRICAVHDKPYASRYVLGTDGRFRYAGPIQVTKSLYRLQYEDSGDIKVVPSVDIDVETCAWCAASGRGAIRCGRCRQLICRGKTVHKRFRCRESCGREGDLAHEDFENPGVNPFIDNWGSR